MFGLSFCSEVGLPGAHIPASGRRADVTIRRLDIGTDLLNVSSGTYTRLACRPPRRETGPAIWRSNDGRRYMFRYDDGAAFIVDPDRSEILTDWPPELTNEDVATYLVGPICGLLLYLRGATCLHASAVAHQGRAIAFVGGAEAGKSTLVAQFARLGHRVFTDDILQLRQSDGGVNVIPSFPRIGLWPKSVAHLWGDAQALPKQVPNWEKRYFDLLPQNLYQDIALPLAAIYVLADRRDAVAPAIESLHGTDALLALIANKYVTRITDAKQEARDFLLLSKLAASLPVRRINRRDALSDLPRTCEDILTDYARTIPLPA